MPSQDYGKGTVRTVRDRKTGEVRGYRALLPREHSIPPEGCRSPDTYQQPLGPLCASKPEAESLLNAALVELIDRRALRHGLPLSSYVAAEIKSRLNDAKRAYTNLARASKSVATWRSIDRVWLRGARFYDWAPAQVETPDLQIWFNELRDTGTNKSGDPLSGNFIRNIAALLGAAFDRANVVPNPIDSVKLPPKNKPRVVHLEVAAQRRLFRSGVELEGLVMIGCGMGAGLRVGELLSFEADDVLLDSADPHLIVRYGGDHRAPTKGRRIRRVELFEPGLGFWRFWMDRFYCGGERVFAGPKGGYQKAWPERFPTDWSGPAGKKITSHIMRHTYAVAMLSGSWGYEPKSLDFIQQQLGHADRATTERYYGAFEAETWRREVRRMTGRESKELVVVTAAAMLGPDALADASAKEKSAKTPKRDVPRHSPRGLSRGLPSLRGRGRPLGAFESNTLEPLRKKRGRRSCRAMIGARRNADDERFSAMVVSGCAPACGAWLQ